MIVITYLEKDQILTSVYPFAPLTAAIAILSDSERGPSRCQDISSPTEMDHWLISTWYEIWHTLSD